MNENENKSSYYEQFLKLREEEEIEAEEKYQNNLKENTEEDMNENKDFNLDEDEKNVDIFPVPVDWKTFNSVSFPEQRWRIKDLVPYEGLVILASPSGEKKSWLAMEMAKCITSDTDFLGQFPVLAGNVLYINAEMPQALFQRRGRQISINPESKYKLFLTSQDGINFKSNIFIRWLEVFIVENNICTVIIDTLRATAGGLKENEAEEVRAFFDQFKPYKNKGVSIIFLDHCRKPAPNEGKKPKKEQLFASQDKVSSIEILLMLRSEVGSNEIGVFQNKNRVDKEIKPFKILMNDNNETDPPKINFSFEGEIDENIAKKVVAKDYILELIRDQGQKTVKEIKVAVKNSIDVASRNVDEALKELVVSGTLTRVKIGRPFYYAIPLKSQNIEEIIE